MRNFDIGREGRVYLKVKIKSLDEEIRIIRKEMKKARKSRTYFRSKIREIESAEGNVPEHIDDGYESALKLEHNLAEHMVDVVKSEYRHALLALAFCKGMPYAAVERYARRLPDWGRVERLCKKYGSLAGNGRVLDDEEMRIAWRMWHRAALEHIFVSGGGIPDRKEKDAAEGKEFRAQKLKENPRAELKTCYLGNLRLVTAEEPKVLRAPDPHPPQQQETDRRKLFGIF